MICGKKDKGVNKNKISDISNAILYFTNKQFLYLYFKSHFKYEKIDFDKFIFCMQGLDAKLRFGNQFVDVMGKNVFLNKPKIFS